MRLRGRGYKNMQEDECLCSECKNPKEGSFCNFCKKETPKTHVMHAEAGRFATNVSSIGISVIRGDASVTYFTVVFGVFVAMSLGLVAFVPERIFPWFLKIIGSLVLIVIAFHFCFFNDWFRNYIVGVFGKIRNHKETR